MLLLVKKVCRGASESVVLEELESLYPNMAARPNRTKWTKALGMACWNAVSVRGRKQEVEPFLVQ